MDQSVNEKKSSSELTAEKLVQGVAGLVTLPEISIRIGEMIDDPRCSASHIGKIIGKDAALTARLLKIVNSAFYQFPSRIETVSRAITIIGYRELRDLVFAATVAGIFERMRNDIVDLDSFWRHGIYSGILSRLIAQKCGVLHGERLFIAGLMHDIGQLILSYKIPDLMSEAIKIAKDRGIPTHEAERLVLGFDHAEVGAELMKAWQLPESHQMVARYHHNYKHTTEFHLEVSIVYLANEISHVAETGLVNKESLVDIDPQVWKLTGITMKEVEPLLVDAREQFIEALTLFRPKGHLKSSNAA